MRQKFTTGAWVPLTAQERAWRRTCYTHSVKQVPTCICARKIFDQVSRRFFRLHFNVLSTQSRLYALLIMSCQFLPVTTYIINFIQQTFGLVCRSELRYSMGVCLGARPEELRQLLQQICNSKQDYTIRRILLPVSEHAFLSLINIGAYMWLSWTLFSFAYWVIEVCWFPLSKDLFTSIDVKFCKLQVNEDCTVIVCVRFVDSVVNS